MQDNEPSVNVLTMVADVLYNVLSGITGVIGLTPVQLVLLVVAVGAVFFLVAFVRGLFGRPSWSVYDETPATVKVEDSRDA